MELRNARVTSNARGVSVHVHGKQLDIFHCRDCLFLVLLLLLDSMYFQSIGRQGANDTDTLVFVVRPINGKTSKNLKAGPNRRDVLHFVRRLPIDLDQWYD